MMKPPIQGSRRLLDDVAAAMRPQRDTASPKHEESIVRSGIGEPLAGRFVAEAEEAGMHVSRIGEGDLFERLASLVQSAGGGPVLLEPSLAEERPELRRLPGCLTEPTEEELFSARVGVVGAEAALAETGSIVRASGPGRPRGMALVPMTVIVVLGASRISTDIYDYLAGREAGGMPSELVIITGPSKTADIGMKLVTGIPGPGVVHVVLLEDA
jgi:L-lactate dehydrogenase complex protein LldG